jgi:hypothetical protein
MASTRKAYGLCDTCGFRYPLKELRLNSYGGRVCPTDYEGMFDLKNHPQNFSANTADNTSLPWARPDPNNDRTLVWQSGDRTWADADAFWNAMNDGEI